MDTNTEQFAGMGLAENRGRPDRRKAPRREEERHLHYAREALIAAALAFSETEGSAGEVYATAAEVSAAAAAYRVAEAKAKG